MSELDLLLRGGLVVDGTGAPAGAADVGVAGGRVAHLAPPSPDPPAAREEVDCTGLVVGPGFVDLHSHADFTLADAPAAETQLAQGVTTLVVGNCGFAPFPVGRDGPAALRRQAGFLADPMDWDWTDARGFADSLDRAGPGVNVVLQAGHHALRTAVVGNADRAATPAELAAMCALLEAAADDGVFGYSTGLIYAPGRFAHRDELLALARTAARRDLLYSTHVRDETSDVVAALGEAIDTANEAGVRLEVSHLKAMGRAAHGSAPRLLELVDGAAVRGQDVAADVYPFTASSTTLASRLPSWVLDGGSDALVHRLADPGARRAAADALRARIPAEVDPDGVMIAGLPPGRYRDAIGLSVAELARREGRDAAETVLDLLAAHHGQVSIVNHSMADADLETIMTHPRVSIASDGSIMRAEPPAGGGGLPHPRSFATAASTLGHYVRERGLLTVEQAVHKMSGLPASRIGLTDRGVLRPGAVADVAVWDPGRVAARATYRDPWRLATGVEHVLVGGAFARRDGHPDPHHRGRVLRRTGAATTRGRTR